MRRFLLGLIALLLAVSAWADGEFVYFKKKVAASSAVTRTDNFNRTENPLTATNWTTAPGSNAVQANGTKAAATANGAVNASYYSGATFSANHYAETTWETAGTKGPLVRVQSAGAALNAYGLKSDNSTTFYIRKCVDGTWSTLGATITVGAVSASSRIRLDATGTSTTTVKFLIDDVEVASRDDSSSPHNGGAPGISFYYTDSYLDDWEGGDL